MGPHINFANRLEKAFYRLDRSNKLEEQKFKCFYCGDPLTYSTVTADHVIPLSKTGRKHSAKNIVAACKKCNLNKGSEDEYTADAFAILLNEISQRVRERGWLAEFNIMKAAGLNVKGSYTKWVKYKKKIGDYK
jgi:5-methylcytosine-specific restriction endonuclease McrA